MFTVNSDMCIKMNKGDDVQFPLFVNNGTRLKPSRYVFTEDDGCEVYFYILPLHKSYNDFILKKTYKSSGEIITEKCKSEEIETRQTSVLNNNGDFVILLDSDDTADMIPGHYIYVVRAKVLTYKINSPNLVKSAIPNRDSDVVDFGEADYMTLGYDSEYMTLQITNKYDFYLLDDDINRAW